MASDKYTVKPAATPSPTALAQRLGKFQPDEEEAFMTWYGNTYKDKGWTSNPGEAPVDPRQAFRDEQDEGDDISDDIPEPVSKYTVVEPPKYSVTPAGASSPSWRQGSVKDVQSPAKPSAAQLLSTERPLPSYAKWLDNPLTRSVGEVLGDLGDSVERYVDKPARQLMYKEDPLEMLTAQAPGEWNDASLGDILWHQAKTLGTAVLSSPLTAPVTMIGRLARRVPHVGAVPHEPPTGQSPLVPQPPVSNVPVAPVPDVRTLAQAAQDAQLQSARGIQPSPSVGSDLRSPVPVGELPTGSILRGHVDPLASQYQGPQYQTLPTGSLTQVKPPELNVESGYPTEYPLLPSTPRSGPVDVTGFESRLMHGKAPEGPPAPPLLSAEDLLIRKRELQQLEFQAVTKDVASIPDLPPESEHLPSFLRDTSKSRRIEQQARYEQKLAEETKVLSPREPQSPPSLGLRAQPVQAGPASAPLTEFSTEKTLTQRAPRSLEKVFLHALDVLPRLGPYTTRLKDILHYTRDYSEQGTMHNFLDYTRLLESLYGKKTLTKRYDAVAQLPSGTVPRLERLQALLNASVKDYGLTQKESDALVELHYAQGNLEKVSQYAKDQLPVRSPKVQKLFQDGWQIATGRASSHPAVQQYAKVHDPITGDATPVGPPTPYWPHQATSGHVKELLSEDRLQKIYSKGRYDMSFEKFKEKFIAWYENDDPGVQLRKFAGIEYKRFFDALDDANSHKRGVADSLRKMGYETDPLRMLVRHNMFALKRAAYLEHEAEITQVMTQLGIEYGLGSQPYKWVKSILDRSQGISKREDFTKAADNPLHIAQSIAYPAFLKASWKQNFLLQPNYSILQSGLMPVVESSWKFLGSKLGWSKEKIFDATQRSGATFPHLLTSYHLPEGYSDQYAKLAQSLNLFSGSDKLTRRFAALAEAPAMAKIGREFWMNPAEQKWRGLLQERNINPMELYTELSKVPKEQWVSGVPPVPQQFVNRAMQVSSNKAMGRTGIHSLQSWAAIDNDLHHIMLMLHRQIASNEGMLWNSILNAPTAGQGIKRALVFLVGAEAAGIVYQGVVNLLLGNDLMDVNKSLVKTFGGHDEAAFYAKALLMGLGTWTAGIALTGLEAAGGNVMSPVYSFMSPPIAALVDETANKLLRGNVKDPLLRLQPSEAVTTISRYGEKAQRERERGGTGVPNPLKVP